MPSPRYTVRLPEPLHTQVQVYLETTRTPFVALRREALSAYLADKITDRGADICRQHRPSNCTASTRHRVNRTGEGDRGNPDNLVPVCRQPC
jgi:hypothetical protein